jgi:hypothetical protein
MVLVGEKSLQQQSLQAVPENGVTLAPFETVARSRTENVSEEFCVICPRNYTVIVQACLSTYSYHNPTAKNSSVKRYAFASSPLVGELCCALRRIPRHRRISSPYLNS